MTKETPADVLARMLKAAEDAESIDELATPGTYATQYGDQIKGDIDETNVEAFLHGSSVVNLLIQEAILRVTTVAQNAEGDNAAQIAYSQGVNAGALLVAQIMSDNVDDLIHHVIESASIARQFYNIVNNIN